MINRMNRSSARSKRDSRKDLLVVGIIGIALIVFGAAVVLYFKVLQPRLAPKTTVILEPDTVLVGATISQDTLEETAKILRNRMSFLGYGAPWSSFEATNKGQIVAKIPAALGNGFADRLKVTGVVEFVDFGKRPTAPGTVVNTDYTYGYIKGEGTQWHTIMTGGQIHTISAYIGQNGTYEVLFSLTDSGKKTLAEYSTNNTDSYLGIVLDKLVIACPRIAGPITNGNGVINGQFTKQNADLFVALVRSGPLPIPLK